MPEFETGSDYPRLNTGSKGGPRYVRPFMKFPGGECIDTVPTANEILEAVHRHQRAVAHRSRFGAEEPYEDESAGALHSPPKLEKISVITNDPQPFYVTTFLYMPEDDSWQDWYVCDPFLPGSSSDFLYKEIERSKGHGSS